MHWKAEFYLMWMAISVLCSLHIIYHFYPTFLKQTFIYSFKCNFWKLFWCCFVFCSYQCQFLTCLFPSYLYDTTFWIFTFIFLSYWLIMQHWVKFCRFTKASKTFGEGHYKFSHQLIPYWFLKIIKKKLESTQDIDQHISKILKKSDSFLPN